MKAPLHADEFIDSSTILHDATELQRRAHQEGYLFFPGLLERAAVLRVRKDFVKILQDHDWLAAGTDPMDASAGRNAVWEGQEEYWPILDSFQRLESFHRLAHEPSIVAVFERIFDESVLVHPRNIGRIMFPTTPQTPPHQDYGHIKGTPSTWSAWLPLGDCPRSHGALAVMPRTHREGLFSTVLMPGAGGEGIAEQDLKGRWVSADFNCGDVLMFHSHLVHRGLANTTADRLRISCDFRYQPASEPVHASSLRPHYGRMRWERIYQGWQNDDCKYYWTRFPLKIVDSD